MSRGKHNRGKHNSGVRRISRFSLPGLMLRQSHTGAGGLIALAVIVLIVSGLAAAAPLALQSITTSEIGYQANTLPTIRRDLSSTGPGGPLLSPGANPFDSMDGGLAKIRSSQPQPLRGAMGTAQWVSTSDAYDAGRLNEKNDPISHIRLTVAPGIAAQVHITDGALPASLAKLTVDDPDPAEPVQIMLSTTIAKRAKWPVGQTRVVVTGTDPYFAVTLSGTFAPKNAHAGYWSILPTALTPSLTHTAFSGSYTLIVTGDAFIDPRSWPAIDAQASVTMTTTTRYPFHANGITTAQTQKLLPQLRQFTANRHVIGTDTSRAGNEASQAGFSSDVSQRLEAALQRGSTASAVVSMAIAGPIGVAVAVLWLLSRLIIQRRRDGLALAKARGAAGWQIRLALALEVLIVSVPATVVGTWLARGLFGVPWGGYDLVVPVIVALAPPILIGLSASAASLHVTRSDANPQSRQRVRWITEVVVLALTALAVALLLQRGLTTTTATGGVDPLLAATPLLLALSTAVIVLHLFPLPLIAVSLWLRGRRGIVAQLGTARAIRDSAAGLAPVLALVVGVSVTVFSGVLLTTVGNGVQSHAASVVGADIQLSGTDLSKGQLAKVAKLPGVAATVGISIGAAPLDANVASGQIPTQLLFADTAKLAAVQKGISGSPTIPPKMDKKTGDAIPIIFSDRKAAKAQKQHPITFNDIQARVVGDPGTSMALTTVQNWALIDTSMESAFNVNIVSPRLALIRLTPGADAAHVVAAADRLLGGGVDTLTQAQVATQFRQSPVASGLQAILLTIILAAGLLCAAAVLLAMMISASARKRLLAMLRIMGLSAKQSRGIVGWEIGPSAIVAIIVGAGLGIALTLLVLAAVDVRTFTGQVAQPAASVNPLVLLAITGGFVLVVFGVAVGAMAAVRRVNLARTLRTSEEG